MFDPILKNLNKELLNKLRPHLTKLLGQESKLNFYKNNTINWKNNKNLPNRRIFDKYDLDFIRQKEFIKNHSDNRLRTDLRKPYKILCLDGGGVRGIITIILLNRIMNHNYKNKHNTSNILDFLNDIDFICGTSAGGLITLM